MISCMYSTRIKKKTKIGAGSFVDPSESSMMSIISTLNGRCINGEGDQTRDANVFIDWIR
jgi:hypothetical protein